MADVKPGQIYELIPKIMTDVGAIGKDRQNQQQGYKFRGIDDVYNAMQAPLAKHGVFYVPKVLKRDREERPTKNGGVLFYTMLEVQFTFYAPDGSSIEAVMVGEAMDSGDKSSNKAMSAALKYALLEVFCIPTEEDNDTENQSPQPAARQQAKPTPRQDPQPPANQTPTQKLQALITRHKIPAATVKSWLDAAGVQGVDQLPADKTEKAIKYIEDKTAKKAA